MKYILFILCVSMSLAHFSQPTFTMATAVCEQNSLTVTSNNGTLAITGYTWSEMPAGPLIATPNSSVSTITFTSAGTFTILLTTTDGVSTFTFSNSITVNPTPTLVLNVVNPTPICPPPTYIGGLSMTGSGALNYTWMPGALTGSNVNISPQPSSATTYTLFGTDGNGCSNEVTEYVPVHPVPLLLASANSPVCSGDNICLNASGSLNIYSWQGPCGYSSFNQTDCFPAIPGCAGVFTVGGSDGNFCVNEKTVSVVIDQPTLNVSSSTSVICSGQSATLSVTGANTYTWLPAGNGSSIIVSPTSNTTYTITGANGTGCQQTTVITQSVIPSPTISVVSNTPVLCQGMGATLTANGAASYSVNNISASSIIPVSPTVTTTYTITGTDGNGCGDTFLFTQTVTICSGINKNSAFNNSVQFFPNPSNGLITISTDLDFELVIFDLPGKVVAEMQISRGKNIYDISGIAEGCYTLKTKSGTQVLSRLVIIKN